MASCVPGELIPCAFVFQSNIVHHCRSPSLQGHVSVASCVPGELIPCAFVWHDPRNYPMLQKSPRRSCRIKMRNNRIGVNGFLNQPCALIPILNQSCALGCAKSFCNTICQTWTSATLHSITSSARASRGRRHIEAERPGGLEVDDQLEPRRLYDGQICGLRAVENPAGVGANLPICVDKTGSVAHKTPADNVFAPSIERRDHIPCASAIICSRRLVKKALGLTKSPLTPRSARVAKAVSMAASPLALRT